MNAMLFSVKNCILLKKMWASALSWHATDDVFLSYIFYQTPRNVAVKVRSHCTATTGRNIFSVNDALGM